MAELAGCLLGPVRLGGKGRTWVFAGLGIPVALVLGLLSTRRRLGKPRPPTSGEVTARR